MSELALLDDGQLGRFLSHRHPARRFMVVAVNGHTVEEDGSILVPHLLTDAKETWPSEAGCKAMEVIVEYQFVA